MSTGRKSVKASPVYGSTKSPKNATRRHCHVCRSPKDISKIVSCSSGKRSHIFCSSCVERRLQLTFVSVVNDKSWICPKCNDCCPCSKCRKKEQAQSDRSKSTGEASPEDANAARTLLNIKHSSPAGPVARHHRTNQSPSLGFSSLSLGSSPETSSSVGSPYLSPIALSPSQNPNPPAHSPLSGPALILGAQIGPSSRGSLNSYQSQSRPHSSSLSPTQSSPLATFARPNAVGDRRNSSSSDISPLLSLSAAAASAAAKPRSLLSSSVPCTASAQSIFIGNPVPPPHTATTSPLASAANSTSSHHVMPQNIPKPALTITLPSEDAATSNSAMNSSDTPTDPAELNGELQESGETTSKP